jgi:transketolase
MKSMPDMTVLAPADSVEARIVARLTAEIKGPMYVRMGKTGEPMLHDEKNPPDFQIGKGIILSEGSDVAVVAAGAMVNESKKAAETLRAKGVSVTLVDMHTIRPLDTALVEQLAASHKAVVTVEDHYVSGGLGSSVAEVLAGKNYPSKFRRFGVQNRREIIVGNAEHLKKAHGLSAEGIASKILNIVKEL